MALDNPHDKFFKASFSRKDVVAALIENRFPEPLRKRLDVTTLELTNSSFVDDELSEHFADLVYDCMYSGEKFVKIALLIEHKSYQEDYPHLQLLRYLLNAWQEDRKCTENSRPDSARDLSWSRTLEICPICCRNLQQPIAYWRNSSLNFAIYYTIYLAWSDKEIGFSKPVLALATFLLKHSRAEKFLEQTAQFLQHLQIEALIAVDRHFLESVFVYIFAIQRPLTKQQVFDTFGKISPTMEKVANSIYEQALFEGEERLTLEVIKRSIQEGVKTDFIARILNLPIQKVEEIIEKIKKGLA